MIKELNIDGFKNLTNESFDLKNLTVLTGLNSTGKSNVIQTLLLLSSAYTREKKSFIKEVVKSFDKFSAIRNKYKNARTITINAKNIDGQAYSISFTINGMNTINTDQTAGDLEYERNFYYLSANRVGQEELALYDENQRFGANGNYTFGYYEQHKDDMVCKNLIRETASFTLQTQLGYWLTHILSVKMDLKTEKITSSNVKVSFDADGITGLSPLNVGSGNSYLAKVLIMLLSAKAGDMVIVKNPEVHLHPKAQAALGDFFCFVARAGVQIIVETHSEHFINKLRYEIYQSRISPGEIVIYYKTAERMLHYYKPPHITCVNQLNRIGFSDKALEQQLAQAGLKSQSLEELCDKTSYKLILDTQNSEYPFVNIYNDSIQSNFTATYLKRAQRKKAQQHIRSLLNDCETIFMYDSFFKDNWRITKRFFKELLPLKKLSVFCTEGHLEGLESEIKAIYDGWIIKKDTHNPGFRKLHDRYLVIDSTIEIILTSGFEYLFDESKDFSYVLRIRNDTQ